MTWNKQKIRAVCLELMGWGIATEEQKPERFRNDGREWWVHGDNKELVEFIDSGYVPDPTVSFDDAIPLMEQYSMFIRVCSLYQPKWVAEGRKKDNNEPHWESRAPLFGKQAETAPLAVCLCALRCAGFNLTEFET